MEVALLTGLVALAGAAAERAAGTETTAFPRKKDGDAVVVVVVVANAAREVATAAIAPPSQHLRPIHHKQAQFNLCPGLLCSHCAAQK